MLRTITEEYISVKQVTGSQPSLQDILKYQDPTTALKQLQEILEEVQDDNDRRVVNFTAHLPTIDADCCNMRMNHVTSSSSSNSPSHSMNNNTIDDNNGSDASANDSRAGHEQNFGLGLDGNYGFGMPFDYCSSDNEDMNFHCSRNSIMMTKLQEPKIPRDFSLAILEIENAPFSTEVVNDIISPQFLEIQTPTEKIFKTGSIVSPIIPKKNKENSSTKIEYALPESVTQRSVCGPPTPGLTLVEQLQMDKPLMDVISNKHKRGYYRCTHCPETFSNIFEYASHMDRYDIRREFKCPFPLCPWKILGLPRRPDLRRHCAIQHKDELPDDLKELLNLNDETYPTLKCPHQYCDKVFHRRDAYNRHISIVHEKLGSRFNKRLFQILADCPYDKEVDRQKFVKTKMKSKKLNHSNSSIDDTTTTTTITK